MSKTTKIIAALGVVAGLGVAALPAFTFADGPSVHGDVEVQVEVLPAIAMTITGNNDSGTHANYKYTAVSDPNPAANPHDLGWYVSDGEGGYVVTSDTTPQSGTTYYTRTPSSYQAVDTYAPSGQGGVTPGASIDTHQTPLTISEGTSSAYKALLPGVVFNGDRSTDETNGFGSSVIVYTNNTAGFHLSVKDADSDLALRHTNGTAVINATEGTLDTTNGGWNYDTTLVSGGTTEAKENKAIEATDVVIDTYGQPTSGGRKTIVDYNVATKNDQATGVYSDIIVYTATCN